MMDRITDLDDFKGKTITDAVEYGNNGIRIRFEDGSFAFLWPFAENDGGGIIHLDTNLSGVEI